MTDKRRPEIFFTTADIMIELENLGKTLNKSDLYLRVNQRFHEKRGLGISKRDFYSELGKLLDENKFQETIDQGSKWKNKPVYITLTDEGKKQYHYSILDISTDPIKYRRKKLFQLLFFYEPAEYGKMFFKADQSFDDFLRSLSLTIADLKVMKKNSYGSLIHFQPVKGIKIRKLDENGVPTIYSVTLPGFTLEEILQYHKKNIQKQKAALATPRVSWVTVEEHEASVYNPFELGLLSYVQFSKKEIELAFEELQKGGLIIPFSLDNDNTSPSRASANEKRYIIADKRLQNFVDAIWELYREKLSILVTKHRLSELDDKDRSWLAGKFGKENLDLILKGMNVWKEIANIRSKDDRINIKIAKGEIQKEQIDFNNLIHLAIKKYKPVLQEYDFPLDLVYKLLL